MPFYEFDCNECHEPFDKLVRSFSQIDSVTCPNCGSENIAKKLSTFAVKGSSSSNSPFIGGASSAPSCSPGGV